MEKEIRSIIEDSEIRTIGDSRIIEGYGIVFNQPSRLIDNRFYEVIKPEAIEGVLENSDVLALLNHDISRGVLARSINGTGSLKLSVDDKGVKYSFVAPKFSLGDELVEGVRRGDIKGSSFSFQIERGGDTIERRKDGTYIRTINKFAKILDMSPCYREAYEDTTVALRSLDEFETSDLSVETKPVLSDELKTKPIEHTQNRVMNETELNLKRRNNYLKYNIK
jgi:hypothetical protein